ncbi:hypothetical protein PC120_g18527 [Phytophthora cactorum]|nr:hypothetical protein PC120_g18527 [Phytophthora cactorum]
MIRFDADLLKLYLARDGGTWLNSNDGDIKAVPDRVKNLMHEELLLDETAKLNDGAYFGKNFRPGDRDIHVLVELPEIPKDVLHYKNCRKWVSRMRLFAIVVTAIGSAVALWHGANPTDEKLHVRGRGRAHGAIIVHPACVISNRSSSLPPRRLGCLC